MAGSKSSTVILIGFLTVATMFAPSSLCARGDPENQREVYRELPVQPELVVELVSADCVVETGGPGAIRLRVVHSYAEDRYQVEVRERSGEIRLQERFLRGSARGSATWTLTVPDTTGVSFSSAAGDFDSSGDYAWLEARSASGRISIRDLDGRIDINTASGTVRLREVAGDLSVATVSGDVEVAGFDGRLRLRTAAGDVQLDDLAAEIEAATASGKIEVSELRLIGECSFSSAAGDVEVELAATAAFDLSLTSATGLVELDLNGNEIAGTFVFSALQYTGRIESPVGFDEQEIFVHAGQTYLRKTFSRGSALPRINLATAAGSARLKP
jgi:DUF4097 and DUF4098 domain-containing protein YvlB